MYVIFAYKWFWLFLHFFRKFRIHISLKLSDESWFVCEHVCTQTSRWNLCVHTVSQWDPLFWNRNTFTKSIQAFKRIQMWLLKMWKTNRSCPDFMQYHAMLEETMSKGGSQVREQKHCVWNHIIQWTLLCTLCYTSPGNTTPFSFSSEFYKFQTRILVCKSLDILETKWLKMVETKV